VGENLSLQLALPNLEQSLVIEVNRLGI